MFDDGMTLRDIDRDGALADAAGRVEGDSRADFLRKATLGGGALFGGGALMALIPDIATAAVPKSDIAILNYALTLEYLESEFYALGVKNIRFADPRAKALSDVLNKDEASHVGFVSKAIRASGGNVVKKPKFDFRDTVTNEAKFLQTSYELENTGVPAYIGQVGKIKTPAILTAAGTIVTIEARHCGAIAMLLGKPIQASAGGKAPTGHSFDGGKSKAAILKGVRATGFVKSRI